MGNKKLEVNLSLDRLVPSKDQLNLRKIISEESKRLREQQELDQCTFKPNFQRPNLDFSRKINQIPGIDGHLQRQKQSHEEERRKKGLFEKIGSKYKCQLTEPKPFNLSESRELEQPDIKPPNKSLSNTRKLNKSKPLMKNIKKLNVSPKKTNAKTNNSDPKENEKFAKLRIHYTKDDFAELKVYENSDPDVIVKEFTAQYGIGKPMIKQLYKIIKSKQDSLKSVIEFDNKNVNSSDQDRDESKEEDTNVDHNKPSIDFSKLQKGVDETNEQSDLEDEAEDMRDSSELPNPEPSIERSSEIDEEHP
jgi:hypothetical protein